MPATGAFEIVQVYVAVVVGTPFGGTVVLSQLTPLVICQVPVPVVSEINVRLKILGPFVAPWTVAMNVIAAPRVAEFDSPFVSVTEIFGVNKGTTVVPDEAVPRTVRYVVSVVKSKVALYVPADCAKVIIHL